VEKEVNVRCADLVYNYLVKNVPKEYSSPQLSIILKINPQTVNRAMRILMSRQMICSRQENKVRMYWYDQRVENSYDKRFRV
jgi:transcription initiation factor IIE alpha subunit